jgi:hypothetical protein
MSHNLQKITDVPYTSHELFSKNHIKSTQIIDKIKHNKIQEILEGLVYIKDNNMIIEPKYLKYFGSVHTYDIIVNYIDHNMSSLTCKYDRINMHINLQSISIVDFEKHVHFCKYLTAIFSEKYPERLNKWYIYNVSLIFEAIFSAVKHFIDKVTLNKITQVKE